MPKQVEFAKTIHASGNDLLTLINDILDLSKIESGTVVMDPSDVRLDELQRYVERTFRHVAEAKGVDFFLRVDPRLPPTMFADLKRLQQVLKNLLSNAFKFTHQGSVTLTMEPVTRRLGSAERDAQPRIRRDRAFRCATRASASRPTSSRSSSKRSSRPMAAPAASTAARASGSRSAAS